MNNTNPFRMKLWVTPYAFQLASGLIIRMRIRQGSGLAPMLGLPHFYDNYTAVEQWTQQILTACQETGITQDQLQSKLIGLIPSYLQGNLDW